MYSQIEKAHQCINDVLEQSKHFDFFEQAESECEDVVIVVVDAQREYCQVEQYVDGHEVFGKSAEHPV